MVQVTQAGCIALLAHTGVHQLTVLCHVIGGDGGDSSASVVDQIISPDWADMKSARLGQPDVN